MLRPAIALRPLDEVIAQHEARGFLGLVILPDEPAGQLNLRWPPCLPWSARPEAFADAPDEVKEADGLKEASFNTDQVDSGFDIPLSAKPKPPRWRQFA